MPPRLPLKGFLAAARSALTAPPAQRATPLTLVVGNESADLDSLCSAVVLAYIRTNSPPHTLHIPLSNIPRSELVLRTEMTAVLQRAGLSPSDILTLSELPDLKPEETQWFLVDHNALTGQLQRFQSRVIGCIDHHVDENVTSRDVKPRVIEPCGSCMSLIIDESRAAWDSFPALEVGEGVDATEAAAEEDDKLATLAFAPILIDTIDLKEEHKVKEKDIRAVKYLHTKVRHQDFQQTKFFEDISAVKEDISQLSFYDIFRKDYKEWEEAGLKLGISCVVQDFDYLLEKAKQPDVFIDELARWAKERNLDVASVMTTSNPGGEFQRHLLVWGITEKGVEAAKRFPGVAEGLGLEQWKDGLLDGDDGKRRAWRQRDLKSSRKQVAPLLREALKGVEGASQSQL
ncbi:DHH phosphoesterase [Trichoderma aethiopicum]